MCGDNMTHTAKQGLKTIQMAGVSLLCVAQSMAGSFKNGQGNMTVSPASVNTGSTHNFSFKFVAAKNGFNAGSQATLLIPAGWSPPQTNNGSGQGFVTVTHRVRL